jgi:hypothetical protein
MPTGRLILARSVRWARLPGLPIGDWPDSEKEITAGFYPVSPGSNPGWANICLWKGHPIGDGNRLEAGRT